MSARWALVVTLICGVLATGSGLVPSGAYLSKMLGAASASLTGDQYACATSRCGCVGAREFWLSCSCSSLEQKLAWADAHDVEVPDYVPGAEKRARRTFEWSVCGGGSRVASAAEPAGTHDETHAYDDGADAPLGFPVLSRTGCNRLRLLMALAGATSLSRDAVGRLVPPPGWSDDLDWSPASAVVSSRTIETPTPPPRA